jgi:DNA-directed RNA polymerase specialized sigma subunit
VVCGFALRPGGTRDKTAREKVVAAGMAAVLTERQLLVAAWYWFDGHTQRRIGDFLGCSRGSVCDRLRLIRYTLAAAGLPEPRRQERPAMTTRPR